MAKINSHFSASRHQLLTCITTYNWIMMMMTMTKKECEDGDLGDLDDDDDDDDRVASCHRQVCDTYHKL